MPTYVELMAQIEALQKQAEEVRQAEIAGVIAEIRQKIQDYDLTAVEPRLRDCCTGEDRVRRPRRQARGGQAEVPRSGIGQDLDRARGDAQVDEDGRGGRAQP